MRSDTPTTRGYRMPAEWEPHAATWLAWPHNRDTWPQQLEQVQSLYLHLMAALEAQEEVHVLVNDADTASSIMRLLSTHGLSKPRVFLHACPTVDAWLRDSGPIFLTAVSPGTLPPALIDWRFNAWGNKYPEMLADDSLPQHLATLLGLLCFRPEMVLEGGSIDVNGRGSCLTTEQCLRHPNRNPHLERVDIERYLHDYLNVRQVIWLGNGIAGDDTDGHVDDVARFVNPTTVVCALTEDPQDTNYIALQDNYQRLRTAVDQNGQPLRVVPLPMPAPVEAEGEPLPASYANFYIANGVVLVPTYDCPQDEIALQTLQEVFPTRRVIGLPCTPLVWGLGAIHCITQQQPVFTSAIHPPRAQ